MPLRFSIPHGADFPPELLALVRRSLAQEEIRCIDLMERTGKELERLRANYLDQKCSLATEQQWNIYRELHTARVQKLREERGRLDGSIEAATALFELRHKAIDRSTELLIEAGIDTSALRAVQNEYVQNVTALMQRTIESLNLRREVQEEEEEDNGF